MDRLLISAAHKSSGKTTLSIGLCAALSARGLAVQPFKKGPDYIDPMWLARAAHRACYNLDPFLMGMDEIERLFRRHALGADLCLVEGNKGLYDGLALDGSNSNAALAAALGLPVVLVVDARGMTRGIAPLLLGYQAFDRSIRIAGVILNNLGGSRHEAKLRAVIEHYTDMTVVGAVHADERLAIVERHLGLMPSNEAGAADAQIARIGEAVAAQVDLDRVIDIARSASAWPVRLHGGVASGAGVVSRAGVESRAEVTSSAGVASGSGTGDVIPVTPPRPVERRGRPRTRPATVAPLVRSRPPRLRVGIAMDRAFGFYYADDLTALRHAGAQIVPFDTLADPCLPAVDALFIGGGFPEMLAPQLEANATLRADIRAAIEDGLAVYAECGGLMYLARTLQVDGRRHAMVGALPGDVVMHARPVGRGYVELAETADMPWLAPACPERSVRAHEFHYSSLENVDAAVRFAYRVRRGYGIDGRNDGLVYRNVLASYAHLRSVGACAWAERFVAFALQVKRQRAAGAQVSIPRQCRGLYG
ncbi:MAG TPA: cobyrinate a,c-diamide synthase [Rhodocyclaceae bacterium]|nr:cobyrinate a,c-diamide synthase [Rhodocyclaceae bacterium]